MESKDIRIFVAVTRYGNFSATARKISLTPSAISKAISRLELQLERRLFVRSSKLMALTQEGEAFLHAANRVVSAIEEAEATAVAKLTGTLKVRCTPTFAIYQLAPVLPAFLLRYPGLPIEFLLTNDRAASLDGGVDIAIVSGEPPPSNLISRRIASSRWILCASPAYLAEHRPSIGGAGSRDHVGLNFSRQTLQENNWTKWLVEHPQQSGAAGISSNLGDMLKALALAGAGMARLAEFHIDEDLRSGRLVEVEDASRTEEERIYALYPERHLMSRRTRIFLDFLIETFADPPWKHS